MGGCAWEGVRGRVCVGVCVSASVRARLFERDCASARVIASVVALFFALSTSPCMDYKLIISSTSLSITANCPRNTTRLTRPQTFIPAKGVHLDLV